MKHLRIVTTLCAVTCGMWILLAGDVRCEEKETKPPAVGDMAPDFELATLEGEKHKLSELVKNGPVIVVMLRGYPTYQCPLCSKQVAEFLNAADAFGKYKASVVLIYPDTKEGVAEHAQEFIKGKKFPKHFLFLLDPDFEFTNSYGLRWDAPKETSFPSTFIVDGDQKVTFAKVSRKHSGRSKAKELLAKLRKASLSSAVKE